MKRLLTFPSKPMVLHYCDIFTDCWHCPAPFCPYEKLEDGTEAGWAAEDEEEEKEEEEEEEDEGW